MRLSAPMHDALTDATRNPLRRTHDDTAGAPPWPAHPATLAALTRHELLVRAELRNRRGFKVDVWSITDLGRDTLNPPPKHRADRAWFLAHTGSIRYRRLPNGRWAVVGTGIEEATSLDARGYTTNPRKSIDHDQASTAKRLTAVEIVQPGDLDQFAKAARRREEELRRRKGEMLDGLALEQRIANVRMAARQSRMNASPELRMIERMIAFGRGRAAERRLVRLETHLRQRAA